LLHDLHGVVETQTGEEGRPMAASASIREVAERAGVSVGTVSNVLNRPSVVAPATRDRVLAAIAELGFVRNESARHLRAGRSRTVGLVVLDVSNPFFTDVARGVEDAASDAGLAVILCNSDDSPAKERRYLSLLQEQRVQGVLITPVDAGSDRLAELRARGIPVVLLDSATIDGDQCSVAVDDVTGGDLALTHLIAEGHESVAYVTGPLSIRQCADRRMGALQALARAGRLVDALLTVTMPALTFTAGQRAAERLLAMRPRPSAIFCANDLLALGVLQTLTRAGIAVPGEMALVGYDDIDFAGAAAIPLSSVRQPRQQLGRTAAKLLIEEAETPDDHRHQHVVFQPELIVRDSSRRPG
jgi:LacI family transcriptional regulator